MRKRSGFVVSAVLVCLIFTMAVAGCQSQSKAISKPFQDLKAEDVESIAFCGCDGQTVKAMSEAQIKQLVACLQQVKVLVSEEEPAERAKDHSGKYFLVKRTDGTQTNIGVCTDADSFYWDGNMYSGTAAEVLNAIDALYQEEYQAYYGAAERQGFFAELDAADLASVSSRYGYLASEKAELSKVQISQLVTLLNGVQLREEVFDQSVIPLGVSTGFSLEFADGNSVSIYHNGGYLFVDKACFVVDTAFCEAFSALYDACVPQGA